MRIIRRINAWFRKRRTALKLKKSGCKTWSQYRHKFDIDCTSYADCLDNYYHGYKFIYLCKNPKHYAYQVTKDYGPGGVVMGMDEIADWCAASIKFKYRCDWLRLYKYADQIVINEMGGTDTVCYAFKDEGDYIHFMLRWT